MPLGWFNRATNAMIVVFALGLAAIYLGRNLLSWLPTAGHLAISAGFLLASMLLALRTSGRLGWYTNRTRRLAALGSACGALAAVLNLVVFVTPGVVSKSGRPILLVAFLSVMLVFLASLISDLVSRRK